MGYKLSYLCLSLLTRDKRSKTGVSSMSSTHLADNSLSAQTVTISSSCPYQITVECTSCALPNGVCILAAPSPIPTCLIESNMAFTAQMLYPDRSSAEILSVVEFGGEYSCSFPLWCDTIVHIQGGAFRFTLRGSAMREEGAQ